MNIDILTGNGARWWVVIIWVVIIYLVVAVGIVSLHVVRLKNWAKCQVSRLVLLGMARPRKEKFRGDAGVVRIKKTSDRARRSVSKV